MTVSDNPTTINRPASLRVEESMTAHPRKQQKAKFGHQVASPTHRLNSAGTTHSLACDQHEPTVFLFKYSKVNIKISKYPS